MLDFAAPKDATPQISRRKVYSQDRKIRSLESFPRYLSTSPQGAREKFGLGTRLLRDKKIWKWAGNEASVSLVRRSTWSYMAKGRLRARVRRPKPSKANRWRKGHSSSSNPVTNKHRLSARGKFASHLAQTHGTVPGPTLTTEALTTHDANQEDGSALDR